MFQPCIKRREQNQTETFLVRTSGRYDFLDINFWNQAILTQPRLMSERGVVV